MGVLGKAFAPATDLLTDRRIALGDLVTHRFGLESIGTAFDLLRSKQAGRVILYPNGQ